MPMTNVDLSDNSVPVELTYDGNKAIRLLASVSGVELCGIASSGQLDDGDELKFTNDGAHPVTLLHDSAAASSELFRFRMVTGTDLAIAPGEIYWFVYREVDTAIVPLAGQGFLVDDR